MVKAKDLDIVFNNPRKVYYAGDTVKGSVIVHLDQPVTTTNLDLVFSGKAKVQFSKDTGGKHRQHFWDSERYFKDGVNIHPTAGIPVGRNEFPFTYTLSSLIPSSFESRHASVRYKAEVILKLNWTKTIEVKRFFVVIRPLDLHGILYPERPIDYESELSMCCASGKITVLLRLERRGFVPGETIPVRAEVKNDTSSRITKMYLTVDQTYECFAGGRSESDTKSLKSATPAPEHSGVPAHSSAVWDALDVVTVPVTVPSRLDSCSIIDLRHYLTLNLVMGGALTCNRAARVEMTIGTVPLASHRGNLETSPHQPNTHSTYYPREEPPADPPAYQHQQHYRDSPSRQRDESHSMHYAHQDPPAYGQHYTESLPHRPRDSHSICRAQQGPVYSPPMYDNAGRTPDPQLSSSSQNNQATYV